MSLASCSVVSGTDVTLAISSTVQPLGNFHTSRNASPMFLLGAPPCKATCITDKLIEQSPQPGKVSRVLKEGLKHFNY